MYFDFYMELPQYTRTNAWRVNTSDGYSDSLIYTSKYLPTLITNPIFYLPDDGCSVASSYNGNCDVLFGSNACQDQRQLVTVIPLIRIEESTKHHSKHLWLKEVASNQTVQVEDLSYLPIKLTTSTVTVDFSSPVVKQVPSSKTALQSCKLARAQC